MKRDELREFLHPWLDGTPHCPYRPVELCINHRRSETLADELLALFATDATPTTNTKNE